MRIEKIGAKDEKNQFHNIYVMRLDDYRHRIELTTNESLYSAKKNSDVFIWPEHYYRLETAGLFCVDERNNRNKCTILSATVDWIELYLNLFINGFQFVSSIWISVMWNR